MDLLDAVFPVELVHAAAGIDKLLLAGVKRVALGADLNGDILAGAAGLDDVAAGAADRRRLVVRMDAFLHGKCPLVSKAALSAVLEKNRRYKTQSVL